MNVYIYVWASETDVSGFVYQQSDYGGPEIYTSGLPRPSWALKWDAIAQEDTLLETM